MFADDGTSKQAINSVAKEESRYLVHAMKILSANPSDANMSGVQKRTVQRMQDKFGKGFEGATQLSHLIKSEAVRVEFEDAIKGFVGNKVKSASGALGGGAIIG